MSSVFLLQLHPDANLIQMKFIKKVPDRIWWSGQHRWYYPAMDWRTIQKRGPRKERLVCVHKSRSFLF